MRYVDPDGREEYDSSMTEEQFKRIANGIVVTQDGIKATLNGKTWDETQKHQIYNIQVLHSILVFQRIHI